MRPEENAIKEENESEHQHLDTKQEVSQEHQNVQEIAEQVDDEFDFGKAKMDFFKKRAREILTDEAELEYEGNPMPLAGAYKNLKHAVKNPTEGVSRLDNKPHYMKMTFSQGRQAPAGGRLMELSGGKEGSKSLKQLSGNLTDGQLNPLLLSLKQKGQLSQLGAKAGDNKFLEAVFGQQK